MPELNKLVGIWLDIKGLIQHEAVMACTKECGSELRKNILMAINSNNTLADDVLPLFQMIEYFQLWMCCLIRCID
jgi:hypothetical protein